MRSALTLATALSVTLLAATPASARGFNPTLELNVLGTYASGEFDEGAAEIVAYDARTRRAFVVNANDTTVDVLDLADPRNPAKVAAIQVTEVTDALGNANSVAVKNGLLAVAVERDPKQQNGIVAFYSTSSLALLGFVEVGALPDMVTFTPDGKRVLVANEGEPDDDYVVDPEGSVSIIDLRRGIARARVRTASFTRFNKQVDELRASGVRIFGPNATVAQDLEPEYITTDASGRLAYVALQENNALAIVDIRKARVLKIVPLGFKDHAELGNELDASNRDAGINIQNWPVLGMYQPDSIDSYTYRGKTYIVTANEGDARDYDGFSEEERMGDLPLDPNAFPNAAELQQDENLGRLNSTTTLGDADGDGLYEELYAYGARSFSIWDAQGNLVWDSGNELESITANLLPDDFNSTNDENDSFDNRSDDKGPEPEGLVIGRYFGRTYAFIGLERIGGIMVYDITRPTAPEFVTYTNNRDFSVADATSPEAGDLGPEGLEFVPWFRSPTWRPLLIVGNEISGTTTIYQLDLRF
ncbi:MAG: choice-of-anchor I family protein [Gammaproteobacteria bacterium]|jgi:DNA-binding beta-propeller fold protein YncE|nr:choice-of-anchor I family protein [Gammaproteobacteria bacterium]